MFLGTFVILNGVFITSLYLTMLTIFVVLLKEGLKNAELEN